MVNYVLSVENSIRLTFNLWPNRFKPVKKWARPLMAKMGNNILENSMWKIHVSRDTRLTLTLTLTKIQKWASRENGKTSWKIPFCYENYAVNYLKNTYFLHFIIVLCVYNSKIVKNGKKIRGYDNVQKVSQRGNFPTTPISPKKQIFRQFSTGLRKFMDKKALTMGMLPCKLPLIVIV